MYTFDTVCINCDLYWMYMYIVPFDNISLKLRHRGCCEGLQI